MRRCGFVMCFGITPSAKASTVESPGFALGHLLCQASGGVDQRGELIGWFEGASL
jgi:hypothetical protein